MEYEYWLAAMSMLPDWKKYLLRSHMKSAKAAYYIEETELGRLSFLNEKDCHTIKQARKGWDVPARYEALCKRGIRLVTVFDGEYPKRLGQLSDKPYALYVKGRLPDEQSCSVAVVGARRCTPYGEKYACDFSRRLAECGVQVISGLARGIDGMGHRGALMGKGKTFAVMGNGVDICYPREHIGLYEDIWACGGGILSELPPGTPPQGYHFPRRNRIISGLSDVVLVMEAKEKSGSLITADFGLEQGRDVYALPGPIDSGLSGGCNRLIAQGAGILLSPELLLEELEISGNLISGNISQKRLETEKVLETKEDMVYSSVCLQPKSVNDLIEETHLSAKEVLGSLAVLEIEGHVRQISKNHYVRS